MQNSIASGLPFVEDVPLCVFKVVERQADIPVTTIPSSYTHARKDRSAKIQSREWAGDIIIDFDLRLAQALRVAHIRAGGK